MRQIVLSAYMDLLISRNSIYYYLIVKMRKLRHRAFQH